MMISDSGYFFGPPCINKKAPNSQQRRAAYQSHGQDNTGW